MTYMSSQCLWKKHYKDFLSKPSGLDHNIKDQCWHLFVPKYNCQGINAVPEKYIDAVDHEDPGKPFQPVHPVNHWPLFKMVINENKVLQVDQWNISEGAFGDITFCRAFRDNAGNARDMKDKNLMTEIQKNAKNLAKQSAFSDIADILTTVSTPNFLTPGLKNCLTVANTQVDPPPPGPHENDWELKYYNKEVMLSCVRDHSMNLSLLYESDDDYVDPKNILAEPPPEMEDLDVDVEDVEMQPQPGPSGLGAAGPSVMGTAGATPMGPGGDVITDEIPLRRNQVRFDPLTDLVVRQYISSIPEPNLQQRGIWTPTRTPRTRAQHRAAAAYLATQQAITASPFAVQTQQPVRCALYTQGISTVTQTTTPSTGQALTTTETAPTSPLGGITTAVHSLTITAEPPIPGTSTGGAQGAVGGAQGAVGGAQGAVGGSTAVTPTVSPTKGKLGSAFDKLKQKISKKR